MTHADVYELIKEGCSPIEIALFFGVRLWVIDRMIRQVVEMVEGTP